MAPDPDAALMVAFQGGDASAFRTLFEKYAPAMVSFCHRFVRDHARAEELAQDVFLKLHAAARRYEPSARFKTYLYRIAANHCLNEVRRGKHQPVREQPHPDAPGAADPDAHAGSLPTPEEVSQGAALGRAVEVFLERLPANQRAALVLCRFEGLSYEEIAAVLDTSVSAVKSLIHRATVAATAALAPFSPAEGKQALR
jgi:RNA polymerase sigma-70 factor (ECF subfamily)